MRTTRKVLVLLAIVAVMVAALVVSSYAVISYDPETNTFPGGSTGEYKDVYAAGWAQIAGGSAKDANGDGDYDDEGDLYQSSNGAFRAYFNESKGTLVIDMANNNGSLTGGNTDYQKIMNFAYWCDQNQAKVTTLEIRDVGHLNNPAYVWGRLKSVKTVKLNANCTRWNGSKSDTAAFTGMTAMDTLLWGTWDTKGEFTKTRGEEGEIDLGGFIYLDAMPTTYNNEHIMMYGGSAVRATSVKKLILPYSQTTKDVNRTYTLTVLSDGTYIEANSKLANFGKEIAKGKPCGVFTSVETGEIVYTVQSYTGGYKADEIKPVNVKAVEQAPFYGDYTGIIPYCVAYNATKLEEVVVPAEVTLEYIEALAFAYCSSLKTINVLGTVSSNMLIENKDAFTGVSGLTINVTSERSKLNMQNALSEAGVTGVTVVNINPPEQTELDKAIVADGFSIRLTDENAKTKGPALRAEFTLKDSVVGNSAVTLEDFGVVVFSANTLKNAYDNNIDDIYDAVMAGTDARIIRKSAKNGPYVKVHDNGDITFAAAVTGIDSDHYMSEVYTYAYAVWSDGTVTYTTYTNDAGKQSFALYDLTLFLFKNGLANSENTDEEMLWGVLSYGAVPYEGNIRNDQKSDSANYTNATHYLDNPLYAYANYTTFWGTATAAVLEETSSTNVNWSILVDGDKYVVVYRKASGEGQALLPGVYPNNTVASHPYDNNYNRVDAKTPCLTDAAYNKITTVVIDYGVEGVTISGDGALNGLTNVTSIVYPNGFDEVHHYKRDWGKDIYDVDGDEDVLEYLVDVGYKDWQGVDHKVGGNGDFYDAEVGAAITYLFYGNKALKDIIWANNDGIPHTKDFTIADGDEPINHLFDMRGMGSVPINGKATFEGDAAIENIVFGTQPKRLIYENVFMSVTSIHRVWYEKEHTPGKTYAAPLYKTIDVHPTNSWCEIKGNSFNVKSNGYTLVLFGDNTSWSVSKTTFFGGDNADNITVKVIISKANGTAMDPTTAISKICAKITDEKITNRIFFYYPDTDTYKNPSGTAFSN